MTLFDFFVSPIKESRMDNWSFGITMTVVGTGGTFITMVILILVTNIFKKVFPVSSESKSDQK
jgi:Na+-transporting methylmalonyl-CoA/oxaloacetate decarboxylase gamma subunit